MIVHCPECKRKLTAADEQIGKRIRCPRCEHRFTSSSQPAAVEPEEEETIAIADAPSIGEKKAGNKAFMDDLERRVDDERAWKQHNREWNLRETMMSGMTGLGMFIGLLMGIGVSLAIWSYGYVLLPRGWMCFISLGMMIGTGIGAALSSLSVFLDRRHEAKGKTKKKRRVPRMLEED